MSHNTPPRRNRPEESSMSTRTWKWPPWHWPWWLVLAALEVPLIGGSYLLGALSTIAQAKKAISSMRATMISGNSAAVTRALSPHDVWAIRFVLVALGVAIGFFIGKHTRRSVRETPLADQAADTIESSPRSPWLRELLAAVIWAVLVGTLGYLIVHSGGHILHDQLAHLPAPL